MGERPAGQLVNGLIVSEPRRGPNVTSSSASTTFRVRPLTTRSFYRVPVDRKRSRSHGIMWDSGYDSSDAAVAWVQRVTCNGRCLDERREQDRREYLTDDVDVCAMSDVFRTLHVLCTLCACVVSMRVRSCFSPHHGQYVHVFVSCFIGV